jgi:phytoene dehydrogenase-like protein
MGAITAAIARAATEVGVTIHTDCEIRRISVGPRGVDGLEFAGGEHVAADVVLSNLDMQQTFGRLFDPGDVPGPVRRRVQAVDSTGTMARVHLLTDELPHYVGFEPGEGPQHRGFTLLGGTHDAYERAWDAQRRGELLSRYPVEMIIQSVTDDSLAPPGMHTLTTGVQQLPFELAEGDWDARKDEFTERVIESIAEYAPNIPEAIKGIATITPLDLEREYGLTGGNIFQGALSLDQLFASRAFGGYGTPVRGLYLCGAATHPGGAVMGAPGHNAAMAVLRDVDGGASPGERRGRPRRRFDPVDRLGSNPRLRPARDWVVRQPWLRPVVRAGRRA